MLKRTLNYNITMGDITNYNDVINKLQDYMLIGKKLNALSLSQTNIKNNSVAKSKNNIKSDKRSNIIYPEEKDDLFWCFYIIKFGYDKYKFPGATSYTNEKNNKFKLIDDIRKEKNKMKEYKIRNIKEEVENYLANTDTITFKTFIACCIAHNINIFFINNQTYYEIIHDESLPIHVIHRSDVPKTKYGYEENVSKDKINSYRESMFKISNLDKPLKAIGSYKLNELLEMCQKLRLKDNDKPLEKKKKQELYEMLILTLQ